MNEQMQSTAADEENESKSKQYYKAIIVHRIPEGCTEGILIAELAKYGDISSVKILVERFDIEPFFCD